MATRKTKKETKSVNDLLDALKFISVAQHSDGTPMQMHCRIADGTIMAFEGGLMAGRYVDENLFACPHTNTFISALSKCEEAVSITQLDSGKLSVKSGKFRALVPCAPFETIPALQPDSPCGTLTDALKVALRAVLPLAEHGGSEPFTSAVLLQAQTVVTTNRFVLLEAWHGIDLPPNLLIPKASVEAVCKQTKSLKAFGYSSNSVTFFFEDDSFIKTQLFVDKFPDYKKLLDIESNAIDLPKGFYEAVDKVTPFSPDGILHFSNNRVSSAILDADSSSHDIESMETVISLNANYLKIIKPHCARMHFNCTDKLSLFFGDNVRGAIARVNVK